MSSERPVDSEATNVFQVMSSSLLHWTRLIIGGLSIPLIFPLLVYNLYRYHFKNKIFRDRSLEDKVVLITGASSGLGEALSHAFHKAGCRVILAARRRDALEKVKEDLMTNYQSKHIPAVVTLDLHDLKTISERAQGAINIYGHIDILVNNGGISYRGEVSDTSLEVDLRVMVTNYFGPVALTKAILPSMIQRNSGCIVAVSSVQGKIAIPFRSAYSACKHATQAFFDTLQSELSHTNIYDNSASKHATQAFFDTLKSELSHTNIHVCVVSPGYVQTNLSLNAMTADGSKYGVMDKTTATGMDPKEAAESIIIATASKRTELVLAGMLPKLAILIRDLCPWLYFYLMGSRARRMRASNMIKQD